MWHVSITKSYEQYFTQYHVLLFKYCRRRDNSNVHTDRPRTHTHTVTYYDLRYFCINYFVFVNYYIICRLRAIGRRRAGPSIIFTTTKPVHSVVPTRNVYYSYVRKSPFRFLYCCFVRARIAELLYIVNRRESPVIFVLLLPLFVRHELPLYIILQALIASVYSYCFCRGVNRQRIILYCI